ncbi:MAG: MoxR family ATPase [Candidatus Nanoarchaeia archaeon]|jgi:MoxR-like ATPase|nr:MoxR family ATPase [Candidatus Nanoarchaeia archaeon]MDD3993726.1 MoxR family ATPase [Candidatus Nanoarchaeia archaeon]MDD4563705.1 MoxR family ATPase [Candidatus Nanoarchaeia archaeon]
MVNENKIDHKKIKKIILDIEHEVSKMVVGQKEIIRGIIRGILCNGHVLVEGVPGVAKTLVIMTIGKVMGCEVNRIQFTVDLLPTDITGIQSYTPGKGFEVLKGPIFANFIIADEINRSPSKTQSALLEAMQEKKVTISKKTYDLPLPFFVMATQNPLENTGVYQLPEAQIDRFLFKLLIDYPTKEEEIHVLEQNMTTRSFDSYDLKPIANPKTIINLQREVKKVFTSDAIKKYIIDIVNVTRDKNFSYAKYISYGASPRAAIALFIASKAESLMQGRNFVTPEDIKTVIYPVLRHRIILNYQAEAEKVSGDDIINEILKQVKVP